MMQIFPNFPLRGTHDPFGKPGVGDEYEAVEEFLDTGVEVDDLEEEISGLFTNTVTESSNTEEISTSSTEEILRGQSPVYFHKLTSPELERLLKEYESSVNILSVGEQATVKTDRCRDTLFTQTLYFDLCGKVVVTVFSPEPLFDENTDPLTILGLNESDKVVG